jgi:hypothetical protein
MHRAARVVKHMDNDTETEEQRQRVLDENRRLLD